MKQYKYKVGELVKIKIERNYFSATISDRFHNRNKQCCYTLGEHSEIKRTEQELYGKVAKNEKITYYKNRIKHESFN